MKPMVLPFLFHTLQYEAAAAAILLHILKYDADSAAILLFLLAIWGRFRLCEVDYAVIPHSILVSSQLCCRFGGIYRQ